MPRGVKNTPPTPSAPAIPSPAPLIILQPNGESVHFNAFGLEIPEIVDALRLAIVHMVGKQAGVVTFDEVINRQQRIWVPQTPAATPRVVGANGKKPGKPAVKRLQRFDDEPDLREDLAAVLDSIEG